MAGFSVIFDAISTPQTREKEFNDLLYYTKRFKYIESPSNLVIESHCSAAKVDSHSTLFPGIIKDNETGSWILLAGTVISLSGENNPTIQLKNLLKEFIYDGRKALENIDGHFALVIYNGIEHSLSIISDPIGLFSIFFSRIGRKIFISSSALAIAKVTYAQPDILSIEHFLRMGRQDGEKTLWMGVKRLQAARMLKISDDQILEIEYWSPTFNQQISGLSIKDALDQADTIFTKSFFRALTREGTIWADLTGGFDSRLTTSIISKLNIPFIAYCLGTDGNQDVIISQQLCEISNWQFKHVSIPPEWEEENYHWFDKAVGKGDGQLSALALAYALRGHVERNAGRSDEMMVNVTGGGGENWRGYYWLLERNMIGKRTTVNYHRLIDHLFNNPIPDGMLRFNQIAEVKKQLIEFTENLCSKYAEYPNIVKLDRFEIYRDAGHGGAYLSGAAGIVRPLMPLCFKEIVDFAFSLNFMWKLPRHHFFIRAYLEKLNPDLANINTTTGGPATPIRFTNIYRFWPLVQAILNRRIRKLSGTIRGISNKPFNQQKQNSYHPSDWQNPLIEFAVSENLLIPSQMHSAGLYHTDALQALVKNKPLYTYNKGEFLNRVITVEMALRATGTSVD